MAATDEPLEMPEDPMQAFAPVVLLVEDDDELRGLLGQLLRREGLTVREARSGREALAELATGVLHPSRVAYPDLLVTDLRMPEINGQDLLDLLHAAGVEVPVIVITAFGDEATHARANRAGASVVLDKPFPARTFVRAVTRLIGNPGEIP